VQQLKSLLKIAYVKKAQNINNTVMTIKIYKQPHEGMQPFLIYEKVKN